MVTINLIGFNSMPPFWVTILTGDYMDLLGCWLPKRPIHASLY